MCARIGVYLPASWLEKFFMIEEHLPDNVPENYNLGPMQDTMIVRIDPDTGRRALTMMHWGLVPPWSRTGKMDSKTINARSETVATAPIFRDAYKARRCIVPADNYYEWKKLDDSPKPAKQPYAIARADGLPLFLAGLWETWRGGEGKKLRTFTVLTTAPMPGSKMSALHERMPVVLSPADTDLWLGERQGDVAALMKPAA